MGKVRKSGEKLEKVGKSGVKLEYVGKKGKSGKKLEKVVNKWQKVGKVVKSWNKWGKVGKNGEKWRKVAKTGEKWGKVGKKWGNFVTKWPAAAILDDQKSLSIAFLAISDQYATFFFGIYFVFKMAASSHLMKLWSAQASSSYFHKMVVGGHFGFRFSPKSIGFFHSRSSMAVSNMNLIRALVSQLRETQA